MTDLAVPQAEHLVNPSDIAKRVLIEEANAVRKLAERVNGNMARAVDLILASSRRTVICGMGKSGIIGKKIAATLASTGTPSFFVHPGDAYHGDLGMFMPGDVAVLISYSGETDEVVKLLPVIYHFGIPVIAITGRDDSTLGKAADVVLDVGVERETCPHNLAPTSSTTATLAMGDALAVALMTIRGFRPEDFALRHPGGSLGRRLLTRVRDVMVSEVPTVAPDATMKQVIAAITAGRVGLCVVESEGRLAGIITDGDLRRAMEAHDDVFAMRAECVMTATPVTIPQSAMFAEAEQVMRGRHINALIAVDEAGRAAGVVQIY